MVGYKLAILKLVNKIWAPEGLLVQKWQKVCFSDGVLKKKKKSAIVLKTHTQHGLTFK